MVQDDRIGTISGKSPQSTTVRGLLNLQMSSDHKEIGGVAVINVLIVIGELIEVWWGGDHGRTLGLLGDATWRFEDAQRPLPAVIIMSAVAEEPESAMAFKKRLGLLLTFT